MTRNLGELPEKDFSNESPRIDIIAEIESSTGVMDIDPREVYIYNIKIVTPKVSMSHIIGEFEERDYKVMEFLGCKTFKDFIPYILAEGNYYLGTEEDLETYKELALRMEEAYKQIPDERSLLEGCLGRIGAFKLISSIDITAFLHNARTPMDEQSHALFEKTLDEARKMEKMGKFEIVKEGEWQSILEAGIQITLRNISDEA